MAAEKPLSPPSGTVDDLRPLSSALSSFTRSFDDLHHLLASVASSLDSLESQTLKGEILAFKPKNLTTVGEVSTSSEAKGNDLTPKGGILASKSKIFTQKGGNLTSLKPKLVVSASSEPKGEGLDSKGEVLTPSEPKNLDLTTICSTTNGKALRKHLVLGIRDVGRLRAEMPAAIANAPDPAQLVFSSLGGFYRQGRKAFSDPDSTVVAHRRAAILVLEFFLLSGRAVEEEEVEESLRRDTDKAVRIWRSRLLREGGLEMACEADVLGLVLLVSAFGVPREFGSDDIYELLHFCNLKKNAVMLQKSPILVKKLPGIIQDLVKKNKQLTAAELVIAFGIQDKHPLMPLLSAFIKQHKKTATDEKREGQSSYRSLKEASEKELASLRLLSKFLADYNLDQKDFAGLLLDERVAKLEKEIASFEEKLQNLKRKSESTGPLIKAETQAKIPKPTVAAVANKGVSPLTTPFQEHYRILADSMNAYNSAPPPRYPYGSTYQGVPYSGMMHPAGHSPSLTAYNPVQPAVAEAMVPAGNYPPYSGYGVASSVPDSTSIYMRYGDAGAHANNSIPHGSLGGSALASRSYMGLPREATPAAAGLSSPGTANRSSVSNLYNFADRIL